MKSDSRTASHSIDIRQLSLDDFALDSSDTSFPSITPIRGVANDP